jgi:hypothetical protein
MVNLEKRREYQGGERLTKGRYDGLQVSIHRLIGYRYSTRNFLEERWACGHEPPAANSKFCAECGRLVRRITAYGKLFEEFYDGHLDGGMGKGEGGIVSAAHAPLAEAGSSRSALDFYVGYGVRCALGEGGGAPGRVPLVGIDVILRRIHDFMGHWADPNRYPHTMVDLRLEEFGLWNVLRLD